MGRGASHVGAGFRALVTTSLLPDDQASRMPASLTSDFALTYDGDRAQNRRRRGPGGDTETASNPVQKTIDLMRDLRSAGKSISYRVSRGVVAEYTREIDPEDNRL